MSMLFSIITIYAQNADAGEDQETCGESVQLEGNMPATGTGYWTIIGGGGVIEDSIDPTTIVTNFNEGINTLQWNFVDNGTYDVVTITNNMFYTNAGGDQVVSSPNTDMSALLPEAGQEGTWSILGGAGDFGGGIHAEDATVTDLGYGVNTFRWTVLDANTDCEAYDDVDIIYIGFSLSAGDDQVICDDFTEMNAESASGGTIAYWSITSGNCIIENYDDSNTNITNIEPGILVLRWNAENNGFVVYDEVIIYNYSFETDAGLDQELSENNTQLEATGGFGNNDLPILDNWTGVWDIIVGDGIVSNNSLQNTDITDLYSGLTTLRWTVERTDYPSGEFCIATDTVNLYLLTDIKVVDNQISIFPNPANDFIKIDSDLDCETSIIDITGKAILQTTEKEIDLSNLESGIYILKINTDKKTYTRKLIKQ